MGEPALLLSPPEEVVVEETAKQLWKPVVIEGGAGAVEAGTAAEGSFAAGAAIASAAAVFAILLVLFYPSKLGDGTLRPEARIPPRPPIDPKSVPVPKAGQVQQCIGDPSNDPPDHCKLLRQSIFEQFQKLGKELRKYDPEKDAIGGFPMRGGKLTKPCGHYKEIRDLQKGLKNRLTKFQSDCLKSGVKIDKLIDIMANKIIPIPPGCLEIK
jgi:hypothetical protein